MRSLRQNPLDRLPTRTSGGPLLIIPLAIAGIFAARKLQVKPSPSPTTAAVAAPNRRVVGYCRVGERYESIARLLQGAKLSTHRVGQNHITIVATWPNDRFIGRFNDGKLAFATERLGLTKNGHPFATLTSFLNRAAPSEPSNHLVLVNCARTPTKAFFDDATSD